ncbi:hypothetical protein Dsin_017401 [Dipteronia sinensis]|uniref:ZF-HD dimerization-type domain-containing protein n=1 Tax=Dipteronia sinensis TaxID=43782 RepID=A0AAE0AGC9_9ROSI|nr:hypothetical protein Dsin_017401 [Dipteronia sinensis]
MDLTPTTQANTPTTKSPEAESTETAPPRIQPPTTATAKPISFTNGVLKRHRHGHHHHHHPIVITYKECLKNHAATMGGHALDGCGEFMPSPTATPADPTSLKCAACGCHRNFHRREPEDNNAPLTAATATNSANAANATATIEYQPHHRHHPPPPPTQHPLPHRSPNSSSPPPISSSYYPSAPHMLLALSGNLQNPPPDSIVNNTNMVGSGLGIVGSNSRKRFRTKFSQTQKEKMFEFAERVSWKMQKRDDEIVHEFCNQVGVDRTVLKVWMHNNKNTFAKQQRDSNGTTTRTIDLQNNNESKNNGINDGDDDDNETGSGGGHEEEENGNSNGGGGQNLNHHFQSASLVVATAANGGGGSSSSS